MRIAFIVHTAYPEFIGGREHHVHNLASALSKTDEVVVFSGGRIKSIKIDKLDGYTLVRIPMISIRVSRNPLQIYRILPGLYSVLKKERFDLIHAFEYGSYSTDIAHLYSRRHNIPFLLTVYGYQFKNPLLIILKRFYDHYVGRLLLEKADKIFCPSDVQREEISKIFGKSDIHRKVVFQDNCIQIDNYRDITSNEEILKTYNLKNEVKLLTVARILPRKGIKYLIFALYKIIRDYQFTNIKLMLIGPNCGEGENIKRIVKKLGLEKNVLIIGGIPYSEVKNFLGICDIFVLPSLYEALPLALLEAMAVGRAVIFSNLPCAQKIITNEQDGLLVKPGNIDSLANAILRLCIDKGLREYLGLNARRKVVEFDSGIEALRVRRIYDEVITFAKEKVVSYAEKYNGL